jgi:BirA family biotin operon repressor/biotin-[acetyl-CoA-carboxylase] ligase
MTKPVTWHWFDSYEAGMATPYDIFRLATVESTQDVARLRLTGGGVPALVVADEQLAGRGRQGREWTQPDRGVSASVGFVSDWKLEDRTLIPLVAAVAMRLVLHDRFDVEVGLRWPNDLMVRGDKVGGILVESSGDVVVVGCGVNLWWPDPVNGAAALVPEDPGSDIAPALAEDWASALLTMLDLEPEGWPRSEYESASVTLGRDVYWEDGRGRAIGVADDGALIVEHGGIEVMLRSGEVHTRDQR